MKKILQKDALVLRKKAVEVPVSTITSPKIKKIIAEMKEALTSQDDGVAIATPQIGYELRIFVVSRKAIKMAKKGKKQDVVEEIEKPADDLVFINPVIKKLSKEKISLEEGCLSVRYLYGKVNRHLKSTVEAYDENGKKFTKGASGILSQIFQHEIDHLNGILFTDKAKYVEEILPENSNVKTQISN